MKKPVKAVLCIMLVISVLSLGHRSFELFKVRNGYKTTAHIEYIMTPQHLVVGTYVDKSGAVHYTEGLYLEHEYLFSFPHTKVGADVTIVIDPNTGYKYMYAKLICSAVFYSFTTILLSVILFVRLKRKNPQVSK